MLSPQPIVAYDLTCLLIKIFHNNDRWLHFDESGSTVSKKKNKKKADDQSPDRGMSVTSVTIGVVIVIMFFGWGAMASSYAQSNPSNMEDLELTTIGGGIIGGILFIVAGIVWFFINAFAQIPNILDVFAYCFRQQIGIPICTVIVAILAVLGGFGLKMAEGHLDDPYRKQRESRDDVRERIGMPGGSQPGRRKKKKAKRKRQPRDE